MIQDTIVVGLDVHKTSIAVAVADGGGGEVRSLGTIPHTPEAVRKLVVRLGPASRMVCAYEAGPCGYAVYRQLTRLGVRCIVVAPSLVPAKPGERVKTDRRDATKLARLLRSGELTPIWVPDEEHEALRDLTRAREAAQADLLRARHRVIKLLLRLSIVTPSGIRVWGTKHRAWLQTIALPHPSGQIVLREYLLALDQAQERVQRLEREVALLTSTGRHAALILALQAMRGIGLVTAATLVAELGDLRRFRTPRQLMAYAGLVPREYSSGARQYRGRITKTGNSHVRHTVVQAAWHYRHAPGVWRNLRRRQVGQTEGVKALAWKGQDRLHRRYRRLVGRGKPPQKAAIAVGRELLGFVWAIGQHVTRAG